MHIVCNSNNYSIIIPRQFFAFGIMSKILAINIATNSLSDKLTENILYNVCNSNINKCLLEADQ